MGKPSRQGRGVHHAGDRASPCKSVSGQDTLRELVDKYHIGPDDLVRIAMQVSQGTDAQYPPITVQDLYERWMDLHCIPNLKPTTIKTYQALMGKRVLPIIGERFVTDLSTMDLTRLMADIRASDRQTTSIEPTQRKHRQDRDRPLPDARPISARTAQHIYDTMRDMFDTGVRWELIPANPLDKVQRPRARRKRLTVLDDAQAVELLRRLADEDNLSFRCAVTLALLCGLRLGEVCALRWDDVDFHACTISITVGLSYTPDTGSYIDTPKTPDSERTISLPAGMMALLSETKAQQEEDARTLGSRWHGNGFIVCAWDGTQLHHDTPSKQFRKFADRNGLHHIRFHDLRHSHATLLFANNIDAVAVAHRLGHSSPDTTYRFYAHAIRSRDTASAEAMQQYMDAASAAADNDAPDTSQ